MAKPSILAADAGGLQPKLSSSHTYPESESHQVFLSHAGKQKPFVFDLYNDFVNWPRCPRIDPFFDQSDKSLPKCEEFPDRLFEAARKCVVAVVILTKEYVTSKWPMLELVTFVEAQKSTNPGLKLLPVFYDALPTSSIDDSWIAAWESMGSKASGSISSGVSRSTTISVESCKEALRSLRKCNGVVLTNSKSLQSLRQEIVKAVLKFLPSSSEMDTEKVQGSLRLCTRISEMFEGCKEKNQRGAQCLGLYGMGGLGKTTLCKALCGYYGPEFDHKVCHLEIGSNDIDPNKKKFKRHILILKRLSDLSGEAIASIQNTHDSHQAEKSVQQCLSKQRVFLAVDNVQDDLASRDEAHSYLSLLSSESKIIITSRSSDTVVKVIGNSIYCKPVPCLEEEEAKTLFLKIAAPEQVNRSSLDFKQTRILRSWLQICFFPLKDKTSLDPVPKKVGDQVANTNLTGHYHPLALQAVASYLKDLYPESDSILCWEKELRRRRVIFHTGESKGIFDVLGIGFENMCDLSKQLFIDVALYAPAYAAAEDTFNWLISIHECDPQFVEVKLRLLRKKSFLNYEYGTSSEAASCLNISMHDLYIEFAKRYLRDRKQGLFNYGVYDGGDLPPSSLAHEGWTTVPRIRLQRLTNAAKAKEWLSVVVLVLEGCETITTFSISELVSLRHLAIYNCPKMEVLSWTQHNVAEKPDATSKLRFVLLVANTSLRILPDFSTCSELQRIIVSGCSSSVEPLRLHTCPNLQQLHLLGDDVPEVQSLQSCAKVRSVRLTWKATHKSSPLLENLPCLSDLQIIGFPQDGVINYADAFSAQVRPQRNKVCSVPYDLSGVGVMTNLKTVHLRGIPLGKLPVELGPSLQYICLIGCLLSELVDFNAFTSLHHISLSRTNVEEVRGLDHLKELEFLDFSYCFQLQRVPDLRSLLKLKQLWFIHCVNLKEIPRLPPAYCINEGSSEDECRAVLAVTAFANSVSKPFPRPRFAIHAQRTASCLRVRFRNGMPQIPAHFQVTCDGCMMYPILGFRYKAKPVRTRYDLCSICFSNKCKRNRCSDTKDTKPRWKADGESKVDYNLCHLCFKKSGCDERDFNCLNHTLPLPKGPKPRLVLDVREGSTPTLFKCAINFECCSAHFTTEVDSKNSTVTREDRSMIITFKKQNSNFETSISIY